MTFSGLGSQAQDAQALHSAKERSERRFRYAGELKAAIS